MLIHCAHEHGSDIHGRLLKYRYNTLHGRLNDITSNITALLQYGFIVLIVCRPSLTADQNLGVDIVVRRGSLRVAPNKPGGNIDRDKSILLHTIDICDAHANPQA